MQIEVVDDSSGDCPEAVVATAGKGRVSFFRQPHHIGLSANFTACVRRAKGRWVHILHGDDMVAPGFYSAYERWIEREPGVVMVFCRAICIDEDDEWIQLGQRPANLERSGLVRDAAMELIERNFITASSAVVRRDVYERVGGFSPHLSHTADWEMWMRVAMCGPIAYLHSPLLMYRIHKASDTNRAVMKAENIEESIKAAEIGLRRLPRDIQSQARSAFYANCSSAANYFRSTLHSRGFHSAALLHAMWAQELDSSPANLLRTALSALKWRASAWRSDHPSSGRRE